MIYPTEKYLTSIQDHLTPKRIEALHCNIYKEAIAVGRHYGLYQEDSKKSNFNSILNCKNYIFFSALHLIDVGWQDWHKQYPHLEKDF